MSGVMSFRAMLESRPHAGAWIEIRAKAMASSIDWSRAPMRARGLKYDVFDAVEDIHGRAPMRARGLKFKFRHFPNYTYRRAPMRARGLKSRGCCAPSL